MYNIRKFMGHHYVFKLDGILMSGYFCGIGEVDGNYGMIFIDVKECDMEISKSSCLVVHPLRIKCTLYADLIRLRRACRKIFRRYKLHSDPDKIYFPTFEVNEVVL